MVITIQSGGYWLRLKKRVENCEKSKKICKNPLKGVKSGLKFLGT